MEARMFVYVLKISRLYKLLPVVSSLRTGIGQREEKEQTEDFVLKFCYYIFSPKIVNIGYFRETLKNIFKK